MKLPSLAIAVGFATCTLCAEQWIRTTAPAVYWDALASSSDGKMLSGAIFNGHIFTSRNSGADWVPTSAPYSNLGFFSLFQRRDASRCRRRVEFCAWAGVFLNQLGHRLACGRR